MANPITPHSNLNQQGPESEFSETAAHTSQTNTRTGKESRIRDNKPAMLEIPIFGAEHAQLAVSLGAGRLELNADGSYAAGGTTPSLEELKSLRTSLGYETVPIRIMIRPRGGKPNEQDFIYSTLEYYAMCHAILQFQQSGLLRAENGDGFVFGVLKHTPRSNTDDGSGDEVEVELDIEKNMNLVNIARPFKCVFHRAFDDVLGLGGGHQSEEEGKKEKERKAFNEVKRCGFDGVLTSGGKGSAPENKERLGRILALAREAALREERRVEIIVGGGVRSANLRGLRDALSLNSEARDNDGEDGVKPEGWFHSSCLTGRFGGLDFDGEEVKALVGGLSRTDG